MTPTPDDSRAAKNWLFRFIFPALILIAGLLIARWLMATGPQAKKSPPPKRPKWVEVIDLEKTDFTAQVEVLGTVVPAQQIALMPQVSGKVESVDPRFVPGGRFQAGEVLLSIESTDWALRLRQAEAERQRMEAELRIEQGKQKVAQREFELLGQEIDPNEQDLVLRIPQFQDIQAKLAAAQASEQQAKINLERCQIRAPFNCVVNQRSVNLGSQVQTNTLLATLTGTDQIWVEALVPVDQLPFLSIPGEKGGAEISAPGQMEQLHGTVIQLLNQLEEQGRLAKLLVEVSEKATSAQTHPLLIGSLVQVKIRGVNLAQTYQVDREFVHNDGDIWLYRDGSLEIMPIDVVFRNAESVYFQKDLPENARLITTQIETPVKGMALRLDP
ncbi:MAG: efflux RND transporter periplasmic adaptor subunit [Acidobacteria bacterium]|nr:efflux RND transporter periplasmic adaptor subunit [Acidobacteriota bacterium]MCB9398664.1 efflux RND transporter periplasmic adaptor subunit [Acidobacteriota bacterium]